MSLTAKKLKACIIAEYGSIEDAILNGETDGICYNCGEIRTGVEPDAIDYHCDECGEFTVCGIEHTIICYF